jgi:hypothetical protein
VLLNELKNSRGEMERAQENRRAVGPEGLKPVAGDTTGDSGMV